MSYTYSQRTGILGLNGLYICHGYSGHGAGLNNPAYQFVAKVGPLPQGMYTIGPAFYHPEKGPMVMHLVPDAANEMHGRDGFLLHGDNHLGDHTASEGCIILGRAVRQQIADGPDRRLEVTA